MPLSPVQRANLGSVIDQLHFHIPQLIQKPLPHSLIHPNVCLNLFPESHAIEAHGRAAYRVSTRLLQTALTLFVVPPATQLTILHSYEQQIAEQQRFHVSWRTSNTSQPPAINNKLVSGKILESLNLAPHEFPILAGSFEFRLSEQCDQILVHIIRNVEYLPRPQVECT